MGREQALDVMGRHCESQVRIVPAFAAVIYATSNRDGGVRRIGLNMVRPLIPMHEHQGSGG